MSENNLGSSSRSSEANMARCEKIIKRSANMCDTFMERCDNIDALLKIVRELKSRSPNTISGLDDTTNCEANSTILKRALRADAAIWGVVPAGEMTSEATFHERRSALVNTSGSETISGATLSTMMSEMSNAVTKLEANGKLLQDLQVAVLNLPLVKMLTQLQHSSQAMDCSENRSAASGN